MPAIDRCEPQIVRALEKDGWAVIKRHMLIRLGGNRNAFADLQVRKGINQILIAEVKCFTASPLQLDEVYNAIGQYQVYRNALRLKHRDEPLYLAIPGYAHMRLAAQPSVWATIQEAMIKLIVVDLVQETIIRWLH